MRNGQNVVVFAPRRYGKSSLVWRATQAATRDGILVAQVDLMRAATKEQLAALLSRAIYEDVATPIFRARDRAAQIFRSLRILPVMTVDPTDGTLGFSFTAGHSREDVDATIERLLELPAELAAERGRRVVLVFDEFQEVVELDGHLPALMRAVFQTQPDVSHVYLVSRRSMMRRLFNDENEPFWRSARQMELGPIASDAFAPFIRDRFAVTNKSVDESAIQRVLEITGGHPYGTQELCYALWEETASDQTATAATVREALGRVLRSEHSHFTRLWETTSRAQHLVLQALASEPADAITSSAYRNRHGLPAASSVQKAVSALMDDEIISREGPGTYRISEPFLAEWVQANAL
jgi:AAA+ ATPase superfamily predicted ATPase